MTEIISKHVSVAVFCGSKPGTDPRHMKTAEAFGRGLAERGMRMVYGGGRVGLMGEVARATRDAGGKVTGVIPEFLMKLEVGDTANELEITDSMHSRKQRMFELSDAFVSLAGGLGTLDETVEIITWKQLRLHAKPIIVLSEDGFWNGLPEMVQGFVVSGFAGEAAPDLFQVVPRLEDVFAILETVQPSAAESSGDRL